MFDSMPERHVVDASAKFIPERARDIHNYLFRLLVVYIASTVVRNGLVRDVDILIPDLVPVQ